MRISILPGAYVVCRLPAGSPLPPLPDDGFVAITRTESELSMVVEEGRAPEGSTVERGFALLALKGPIPFSEVGVLASLAAPLAGAGISIFAISTYDTDYLLVKEASLGKAMDAPRAEGHVVAGRDTAALL